MPLGRKDDRPSFRLAPGPFLGEDLVQDRRSERAGEMRAPHAPVKTSPADGPALTFEDCRVDADRRETSRSGFTDPDPVAVALQHALRQQSLEHRDSVLAGKMIVADARLAHGGVTWPRPRTLRAGMGRDAADRLDHRRHVRSGQSIVAMPPLARDRQQAAVDQLRQM